MGLYEQVQETARTLRDRAGSLSPKVGIILGSGLGGFADGFENEVVIPYADLPHFSHSSVPGHAGRLVHDPLNGLNDERLGPRFPDMTTQVKGRFTRLLEDFLPMVARAGGSKA
jgi:hypothetical protein